MIVSDIFSQIINMSLTASWVIAIVLVVRFFLKKAPKIFSYVLWAVVLFRLLSPVSVASGLSVLGFWGSEPIQETSAVTSVEHVDFSWEGDLQTPIVGELSQLPVHGRPDQDQKTANPFSWKMLIPWVWLSGVVAMLTFGLVSYLRFRVCLVGAVPVKGNVYMVDHMDTAFVTGLLRPRIYLPSNMSDKEAAYVLVHERHHIRRFDHVARHLAFWALSIHWFNPLVWIGFMLSGKDMEVSCDEAVIRKLGAQIRADYSASLVSLATSRFLVPGSPLAFGEGSTKERVKNLCKWKRPRKWVSILCTVLCAAILVACASNPEVEYVAGRNDSSFQQNIQQATPGTEGPGEKLTYNGSFSSTEGSVQYTWNLNQNLSMEPMPVVEAAPHYFTEEDVKAIAQAVFPGATYYDAGMDKNARYTRDQIQKIIDLMSQYTTQEAYNSLYYGPNLSISDYKQQIDCYRSLLKAAPSTHARVENWSIHSNLYTIHDGLRYDLGGDVNTAYMRNHISITLGGDGYVVPILVKEITGTQKPTGPQVDAVAAQAQQMLDNMGLGKYRIAKVTVYLSKGDCYMIGVSAIPVIEGHSGLLGHRGITYDDSNLNAEAHAPNYHMASASFTFTAEGKLIKFSMEGVTDVKQVVNSNVAILDREELLTRAQIYLSLFDAESLDNITGHHLGSLSMELGIPEDKISMRVEISEAEFGLARIPAANASDRFYYTPAICFSGTIHFYHKETGELLYSAAHSLVTINAVDGAVI